MEEVKGVVPSRSSPKVQEEALLMPLAKKRESLSGLGGGARRPECQLE